MTLQELAADKDFCARWPLVWNRLQKHLVLRQMAFSREHAGQHEKIGQFVEFTANLFGDLEKVNAVVEAPERKPRPRLSNDVFRPDPPPRKPVTPEPHANRPSTQPVPGASTSAAPARPKADTTTLTGTTG